MKNAVNSVSIYEKDEGGIKSEMEKNADDFGDEIDSLGA